MSQATFDPQAVDQLARAIPGQSLTDAPGQWPFERPPMVVDPEEAFNTVKESLEEPNAHSDIIDLLDVGISAETLASSITLKMFSEGVFSPDVAEIIKPPLVAYITDMGLEAGIEDINVVNNVPKKMLDSQQLQDIMQKVNPQKFERELQTAYENEELDEMLLNMEIPEEPEQSPRESFLDMEVS